MGKRGRASKPVHAPVCWYFRDRAGVRYGPYVDDTDDKAIAVVLKNHAVGRIFKDAVRRVDWGIITPSIEFVMEDTDYHPVDPNEWMVKWKEKERTESILRYTARYGRHPDNFRCGPVPFMGHSGCCKMWKTPNFGRKVRDTGHGCTDDMEPPIRKKLQVRDYAGDDFPHVCTQRSWKKYRQHQWK